MALVVKELGHLSVRMSLTRKNVHFPTWKMV
jgi:hypothetical protein